jgi:hypothetical protein
MSFGGLGDDAWADAIEAEESTPCEAVTQHEEQAVEADTKV